MNRLKSLLALCCLFLIGIVSLSAQGKGKASIVGSVVDERTREAIPYVQIIIKGTTVGTTTDNNGNYKINSLPAGNYTLVASFMGYGSVSQDITITDGQRRHLDLYMQEQSIDLQGVVVSANRQETLRKLSPTLVTVLGSDTFIKTHSENLSQGLRFQPGLRVEDNCQNCGFNQVRINGLEGAYSQILIDSRSVFSALAGVYGLEQIPASMIERVEVMRGGGSALFGSSAIGGVINIITKEPLRSSGSITQTLTSFDEHRGYSSPMSTTSFNASLVSEDRRAALMAFGQHSARHGVDVDGDGFTEMPELKQRSLGVRAYYKTGLYSKLTGEYRSMQEYRRGGDRLEYSPYQAQIAEYLQHFINGGSLKFDLGSRSGKDNLSLYASAQHVLRRSYYGGGDFAANLLNSIKENPTSEEAYNKVLTSLTSDGITNGLDAQAGATYIHKLPYNIDLTLGLEGTYSTLNDKSGFRRSNIDQVVKTTSEFTQLEYKTEKFNFLLGGRFDYTLLSQNDQRSIDPLLIFSPRANLRYNPIKDLSFRLAYSEGFRAPQFFDEEMHVELAGGSPIARILSKDLKEERSKSLSASVDWYKAIGSWQVNLMAEGFYTGIKNQFVASPVEKEVDGIKQRTIINNKDGKAQVYGATFEGKIAYRRLFEMQAGLTLQRSLYASPKVIVGADESNGQKEVSTSRYERTPNVYGYLTGEIRPTKQLSFNVSATYTGKMLVPHEAYGDADVSKAGADGRFEYIKEGQLYRGVIPGKAYLAESKPFMDVDAKVNYKFELSHGVNLSLSLGVQNIFNAYQKDTDMGPGRASTYIYGPMQPRRAFVSATLDI